MKDLRILFREAAGDVFAVWRKEVRRVVHDQGALIFFILVPLFYPLLYAFIYTGEVVREVPVVVVDDGAGLGILMVERAGLRRIEEEVGMDEGAHGEVWGLG